MHKEVTRRSKEASEKLGRDVAERTPAHGGDLGPPSTTPPGNSQHRQQNPGAPVQNEMFGETAGGEHGGAAQAQQYIPQPFSGFNTGQPIGYMQMGWTPGWPPGQVPYAPNTMSTPYQSSVYGMHSQQQYWTPLGPTEFQMAHNNMTKQMLLDQSVRPDGHPSPVLCSLGSIIRISIRTSNKISSSNRTNSSTTTQQT